MRPVAILIVVLGLGSASQTVEAGIFSKSSNHRRDSAVLERGQLRLAADAFPVPVPAWLAEVILEASETYGVDPNLVAAMAFKESAFRPDAVSRRGAEGIMQLMPRTARALGVTDSFDVRQNVFAGTRYIREQLDRFNGDVPHALAAYNAGWVAVTQRGVNATEEATEYVATIQRYYRDALRRL